MKVRRNLSILCQVIIGLLLALSIQSCGIGVSEKEETVIQEILDIYGGTCMMHKGKTTGTEGNKTYFELEISGSPGLEAYKEYHPYMAGIIAHQFYTGLAEERKKYSHIKVTLRYEDGDWHKYEYSGQQILELSLIHI